MEKNCKSCKKFFSCNSNVPFPEHGCSDFKSHLYLFAIISCNSETGRIDVLNIFDDIRLAKAELHQISENICRRPSSNINISIRPYLYDNAKLIADNILISIVNNVAQDLLIAERGFKKGFFKKETFEKSARWFEFAHAACRRGAAILDVINDD